MHTRLSALLIGGMLITACGRSGSPSAPTPGSANPASAPTGSAAGAAITGTVLIGLAGANLTSITAPSLNAAAFSVTVTVVGSSLTATVDGNGQFVLRGIPPGTVHLQFSGPGVDAHLSIDNVAEREEIRIRVRVNGASAEIEDDHRETPDKRIEIEGRLADVYVTSRTLRIADTTVLVPVGAIIRRGGTPIEFSTLHVGDRVHVRAVRDGAIVTAEEVKLQNPGNAHDDDDEDDDKRAAGEVELNGTLSGRAGTCPALTFSVSATSVSTNASTTFDDTTCGSLANGDRIEVNGARQSNGSVLANTVEKKK